MVRTLAALCAAIIVLVSSSVARADRPLVVEEKGAPGSGIVKTIKVLRETPPAQPGAAWTWVESNRTIYYENGTQEFVHFGDDGVTVEHRRLADKTGLTTRFTSYTKSGMVAEDTVREANGKSTVYVNVDAFRGTTADILLTRGDKLYLISTLDSWPGSRSDAVTETTLSGLKKLTGKAPASLTANAKMVQGYESDKAGASELSIASTFVRAGHPGFSRPTSTKYTATVKVTVR